MERTISATEARIRFGELMRRVVEDRERIIVERGGRPQVVVLSIAEYRRLLAAQAAQPRWQELVQQVRAQVQAELGEGKLPPPEEIIRQMRAERDEQLLDLR